MGKAERRQHSPSGFMYNEVTYLNGFGARSLYIAIHSPLGTFPRAHASDVSLKAQLLSMRLKSIFTDGVNHKCTALDGLAASSIMSIGEKKPWFRTPTATMMSGHAQEPFRGNEESKQERRPLVVLPLINGMLKYPGSVSVSVDRMF